MHLIVSVSAPPSAHSEDAEYSLSQMCGWGIPLDKQQLHCSVYCDSRVCDLAEFEEAHLSEDRVRERCLLFNAQLMLTAIKYQGETTTRCITSRKSDSL